MASLNSVVKAASASDPLAPRPTLLSIRNVAKTFGRNPVLRDVSLEIAEGEFLTILGESGSGKSMTAAAMQMIQMMSRLMPNDCQSTCAPGVSKNRWDQMGA